MENPEVVCSSLEDELLGVGLHLKVVEDLQSHPSVEELDLERQQNKVSKISESKQCCINAHMNFICGTNIYVRMCVCVCLYVCVCMCEQESLKAYLELGRQGLAIIGTVIGKVHSSREANKGKAPGLDYKIAHTQNNR